MVSVLAQEDILTLREIDGIVLSPSEVIRLNALGLKVEKGYRPTNDLFTLPRVAVVNGITFYEPTIGHEVWIDDASRIVDYDDASTRTAIVAYALSFKDAEQLPKAELKTLMPELYKFRRRVSKLTSRQLMQAIDYVREGSCAEDGEHPYYKPRDKADEDYSQMSIALGVLLDGAATGIGLTLDDAKRMTRSQIQMMIEEKMEYDGKTNPDYRKKSRMAEYYATLEEIKSKYLKEK